MKISTLIFSGKVFFTDREGIVASLFNTADTSMELFDDMKITEIVSKISNSATYQNMYEMLLTFYYNQVKNYYSKDLPKHIDTFDKFKSEVTYQDTFVETETIDEDSNTNKPITSMNTHSHDIPTQHISGKRNRNRLGF